MGMTPAGDRIARNRGRIFATYAGGMLAFILFLAALEQLGVADKTIGFLFVLATFAVYALIGIAARTSALSDYFVAGRRVPAVYSGMATASSWIGGASFFGLAGTLYVLGFDGLAFIIGWSGGFVLLAVLIAPYLRKFGAWTLPDYLGLRFGGNMPRFIGVLILAVSSFAYAVAQIYTTGLIASRFLEIDFGLAVYIGLGAILLCSLFGGMRGVTWTQVAQYILLIVAYLLPIAVLSAQKTGFPIPQFSYGAALQQIADREADFIITGLADVDTLKAYLTPFSNLDPVNFFALIACLMVGTASLPHLLMRFFTTPSVRETRKSVGWALLFVVLLYLTVPAYAAFAKLEIYQNVIGASIDLLPDWIFSYGRLGLVDVCGVHATTVEALRTACAEIPGNKGLIRLADFAIDRDVVVLAAPEIAGLPYVIGGLVAAGGIAASLSTANGLLLAIANSFSQDIYYRMIDRRAPAQPPPRCGPDFPSRGSSACRVGRFHPPRRYSLRRFVGVFACCGRQFSGSGSRHMVEALHVGWSRRRHGRRFQRHPLLSHHDPVLWHGGMVRRPEYFRRLVRRAGRLCHDHCRQPDHAPSFFGHTDPGGGHAPAARKALGEYYHAVIANRAAQGRRNTMPMRVWRSGAEQGILIFYAYWS